MEKIKETYNKAHIDYFGDHEIVSVDKKDLDWLIFTVEEQQKEIDWYQMTTKTQGR